MTDDRPEPPLDPPVGSPDEAPLPDPYAPAAPPPSSEAARLSWLSVASIVAPIFGPVGAIVGIVFGHHARRSIDESRGRLRGHALATVGMILGAVSTLAWGGLLSWAAWTLRYRVDPAGEEPTAEAPPPRRRAPTLGPRAPAPAPPVEPAPFAPKRTQVTQEGSIVIVDVGIATSSLADELARQRAEATAAGEALVVMTTAGRCDPCRGVDASLSDPLLQKALTKVRLVRVDIQTFHEDLEALKIPDAAIPGFFLPAPDLTPRDGVDGGEWDDDIPVNIAPVLGAFVRGKYERRRRPWTAVPPQGVTL